MLWYRTHILRSTPFWALAHELISNRNSWNGGIRENWNYADLVCLSCWERGKKRKTQISVGLWPKFDMPEKIHQLWGKVQHMENDKRITWNTCSLGLFVLQIISHHCLVSLMAVMSDHPPGHEGAKGSSSPETGSIIATLRTLNLC